MNEHIDRAGCIGYCGDLYPIMDIMMNYMDSVQKRVDVISNTFQGYELPLDIFSIFYNECFSDANKEISKICSDTVISKRDHMIIPHGAEVVAAAFDACISSFSTLCMVDIISAGSPDESCRELQYRINKLICSLAHAQFEATKLLNSLA